MSAKSPLSRQSWTGASESRPGFRRHSRHWLFLRSDFQKEARRSISPESPPPVIRVWLAASTRRSTSQQARERRVPRYHRQAALSYLSSCQGSSLFLSALGETAAVAQLLWLIA